MYGFMRGFQRWVWWPKCAPASSNCCIVTTVVAIGLSPSGYASTEPNDRPCDRHRYVGSACGMRGHLDELAYPFKGLAETPRSRLTGENITGTLRRLKGGLCDDCTSRHPAL